MSSRMDNAAAPRPPLLLALALWGWETGLFPWALALGALLEAIRFSKQRFELRQEDFVRLWNFTALLFLGAALYLFLAREGLGTVGAIVTTASPATRLEEMRRISQTVVALFRWLPFVLYPFLLAQALSRTTTLPWATFSFRSKASDPSAGPRAGPDWAAGRVHTGYVYFAVVLFASSASADHSRLYLPMLLGVMSWALWPWRSPRYPAPVWIGMFLVLLAGSLLAQRGLEGLRQTWLSLETRLFQGVGQARFDQIRGATALGAVGRLKQSGRIVLRIRTDDGVAPGLLREAAFNRFRANIWGTSHREFQSVGLPLEGHVWRLAAAPGQGPLITIARYTSRGEAPLALPGDALSIRDLPALDVETNYLAAARMQEGPPLAIYTVEHGAGGGFDGPPEPEDTDIDSMNGPDAEAIARTARALGLAGRTPEAAVAAVERHFATAFDYTRWQGPVVSRTNTSALSRFLLESRAGHCEYFATATALLLRVAGVPTRYAVGFSPGERRGDQWLARGRDAHAWCLAYIDGRWRDVDTTPGIWREREASGAGPFERLGDWFSQAWYRVAVWRQRGGNWRIFVFTAGVLALSWLAWRQIRGSRWRRTRERPMIASERPPARPGLDSEFYAVTRHLEKRHGPRPGHQTLRAWVRGLAPPGSQAASDSLEEAVGLHYRLRFDPRGLPETDRRRLRVLAIELTDIEGDSARRGRSAKDAAMPAESLR